MVPRSLVGHGVLWMVCWVACEKAHALQRAHVVSARAAGQLMLKPTGEQAQEKQTEKKYTKRTLLRNENGEPIVKVMAQRTSPIKNAVYSQIKSGRRGRRRVMLQGRIREDSISNPSNLRVLAGVARGRKIVSPDVYLRPMMGKVREALFSTLTSFGIFNSGSIVRVLDLFSGSGSVGIEALSRGAKSAVFVDMAPDCVQMCEVNAATCGFEGRVKTVCTRAEQFLADPEAFGIDPLELPFSLVTVTPPYEEVIYSDLIQQICQSKVVGENTIVVIEYPVEIGYLPPVLREGVLLGLRNRRYGRTIIGIYISRPNGRYDVEMRPMEFGGPDGRPLAIKRKQG